MRCTKRGISPLIATVVLVGFVVSLVLIAMLWGKNYIEELAAKRGTLAEKQYACQNVEITAKSATIAGSQAKIVITNQKDQQVDKLIFVGMKGQESLAQPVERYGTLDSLEITEYEVGFSSGDVEKVKVIPGIKAGKNKYVTCSDKNIVVRLTKV